MQYTQEPTKALALINPPEEEAKSPMPVEVSVAPNMMVRMIHDPKAIMLAAYQIATHSPDLKTQNGAVLITNAGQMFLSANSYPGRFDPSLLSDENREKKRRTIIHAETNVILGAAQVGVSTHDATLYCPWACCLACACQMVAAGIKRLVVHKEAMDRDHARWGEEIDEAHGYLRANDVEIVEITEPIPDRPLLWFNGQPW